VPMSAGEHAAQIPGMPLTMTPKAVRGLLPARFGRGVRLYLFAEDGKPRLALTDSKGGQVQYLAATPAGWVEAWEKAAAWARPAGYQRALEMYIQTTSMRRTPLRSAQIAVQLDAQMPLVLGGLMFLGGHGGGDLLQAGVIVDLRRRPSGIVLADVGDGTVRYELAAAELTGAEAGGPGQVTTGGFVATVGHGLGGDLLNQAAASRMNEAFGRSEVRTNVRITGEACELFFRSATDLPEDAQIALSAVRAMASGQTLSLPADSGPSLPAAVTFAVPGGDAPALGPAGAEDAGGGDLVATLERLARLRESGALTELEFRAAKGKLLG
jgi:hypothetical protein